MKPSRTLPLLVCGLTISSLVWAQTPNVAIETNSYDQSETAVAQKPLDAKYLLATWNDFRVTDGSNTYSKPGYAFSTDAGNTWVSGLVGLSGSGYSNGFDPSTGFDRSGNAYYSFIARSSDESRNSVYMAKTTNAGANWSLSKVSVDSVGQDKPYMAIDNTTGTYSGRVYATWTDFRDWTYPNYRSRIYSSYSANGGSTWSAQYTIASASNGSSDAVAIVLQSPQSTRVPGKTGIFVQGSVPAVGPNGEVYVAYLVVDSVLDTRDWSTGSIHVAKSSNGAVSFTEVFNQAITSVWGFRVGKLRASSDPTITVDPSLGYVYVAYTAWNGGDSCNIYSIRSTNGGSSWSSPSVATGATSGQQFFPWLTVSSSGTLSLVYYQGAGWVDTYLAQSFNNGQSFSAPNTKVSSSSMNAGNATWTSDYIGITARVSSDPLPLWTDFRGSNADIYDGMFGTPAAPTGVSISGTTGQHPTISWSANSESDLAGYKLYRKITPDESQFSLVATLSTSQTSWTDPYVTIRTGGTGGQYAYYYVKAFDVTNNLSAASSTVYKPVNYNPPKIADSVSRGQLLVQETPAEFDVLRVYPNPFNPSTTIQYAMPVAGNISLIVYDILGRQVAELESGYHEAGYHSKTWNASSVSSGVYFARFTVTDELGAVKFTKVNKLLLTK